VVGFSNPPGPGDPEGEFLARGFYWAYGAAEADSISVLEGDAFSEAFALNRQGQVVGVSFGGSSGPRGFLWENGVLTDLNRLADVGLDVIMSAQDINDAGQITGRIREAATGRVLAFVATPIGD
jgi:probable HAF family extracellular repeat protein